MSVIYEGNRLARLIGYADDGLELYERNCPEGFSAPYPARMVYVDPITAEEVYALIPCSNASSSSSSSSSSSGSGSTDSGRKHYIARLLQDDVGDGLDLYIIENPCCPNVLPQSSSSASSQSSSSSASSQSSSSKSSSSSSKSSSSSSSSSKSSSSSSSSKSSSSSSSSKSSSSSSSSKSSASSGSSVSSRSASSAASRSASSSAVSSGSASRASGGSSGAGSASAAPGVITACCAPYYMPFVLYAHFSGGTAPLGVVELTWNGTVWAGVGTGCGGSVNVTFGCGTLGSWELTLSGASTAFVDGSATSCSPPFVSVLDTFTITAGGCGPTGDCTVLTVP